MEQGGRPHQVVLWRQRSHLVGSRAEASGPHGSKAAGHTRSFCGTSELTLLGSRAEVSGLHGNKEDSKTAGKTRSFCGKGEAIFRGEGTALSGHRTRPGS